VDAGQVAVVKKAEGHDLGAGLAQDLEVLGVVEVEGLVICHPYAQPNPGVGQDRGLCPRDHSHRSRFLGDAKEEIEVQVAFDRGRQGFHPRVEGGVFADRGEALLAGRDGQLVKLWQPAQDGDLGVLPHRLLGPAGVAVVGDPIQDHAGDPDPRIHRFESQRQGGRALDVPGDVQHEHHRRLDQLAQLGGAALGSRHPRVVQAEHALYHGEVGLNTSTMEAAQQRVTPQDPRIKVAAGTAGNVRQVGGVDVVGTDLEGLDPLAAATEGGDQAGGDRGLAGTAARPRQDQAGCADLVVACRQDPASNGGCVGGGEMRGRIRPQPTLAPWVRDV
jgi:hypothetical protein